MFYTSPEARVPIPSALATEGKQSWWWIEFGLNIPYFLITVRVIDDGLEVTRHLLFSRMQDVLSLAAMQNDGVKILVLNLLCTDYMNGSDDYQFGKVRKIWSCKGAHQTYVFKMADESELCFDLGDTLQDREQRELLLELD